MTATDFLERAKRPRITQADTLASHLANVRPAQRGDYRYTADAPCHISKNPGHGNSFHFGDAPRGGITLSCWHCGSGTEVVARIEDALGCGIQVRWPNGELRFKYKAQQEQRPVHPTARPPAPKEANGLVFHATVRPGPYTLADLQQEAVWFAGANKRAWQHGKNPVRGFRHSLPPGNGDVRVARYGGKADWKRPDGVTVEIQVYPWMTRPELLERIAARSADSGLYPCMSLAGNADTPNPTDVVIVDFDYSPDSDTDGAGRAFRDNLKTALVYAGAPIFTSTSRNGFHGLARMDPDWVEGNRAAGCATRWPINPKEKVGNSAVAEVFPAGHRRHVVIKFERALKDYPLDTPIPVLDLAYFEAMIQRAAGLLPDAGVPAPPISEYTGLPGVCRKCCGLRVDRNDAGYCKPCDQGLLPTWLRPNEEE